VSCAKTDLNDLYVVCRVLNNPNRVSSFFYANGIGEMLMKSPPIGTPNVW